MNIQTGIEKQLRDVEKIKRAEELPQPFLNRYFTID